MKGRKERKGKDLAGWGRTRQSATAAAAAESITSGTVPSLSQLFDGQAGEREERAGERAQPGQPEDTIKASFSSLSLSLSLSLFLKSDNKCVYGRGDEEGEEEQEREERHLQCHCQQQRATRLGDGTDWLDVGERKSEAI